MGNRLKKLKQYFQIAFRFLPPFLHFLVEKPLGKLIYGGKRIWLFSERGTDAKDNGLYMYRYVRQMHPEIKAYFVIAGDSPYRKNFEPGDQLVSRNSWKHRLMFYGAEYGISTHIMGDAPDFEFQYFMRVRRRVDLVGNKRVMLQHGVIKDDLFGLHYDVCGVDLLICGAKPEYDYVQAHYGYPHEKVQYTGLARYDGLHHIRCKRQILLMPTWRHDLKIRGNAPEERFKASAYYRHWQGLLRDPRLGELARKHGFEIVFYPHDEVQPFIALFDASESGAILADHVHYDVQTLLKESMLLITDFSSVFFDFAYMQKPVLYYQFDEAEYRAKNYKAGYFDYRRDGFGEVITDEEQLLNVLEQYLEAGCHLKPEYAQRIERFFPLHDAKNCERIYNEIVKLNS